MRPGDSRAARASSSDTAGCHPRAAGDSAHRAAISRSAATCARSSRTACRSRRTSRRRGVAALRICLRAPRAIASLIAISILANRDPPGTLALCGGIRCRRQFDASSGGRACQTTAPHAIGPLRHEPGALESPGTGGGRHARDGDGQRRNRRVLRRAPRPRGRGRDVHRARRPPGSDPGPGSDGAVAPGRGLHGPGPGDRRPGGVGPGGSRPVLRQGLRHRERGGAAAARGGTRHGDPAGPERDRQRRAHRPRRGIRAGHRRTRGGVVGRRGAGRHRASRGPGRHPAGRAGRPAERSRRANRGRAPSSRGQGPGPPRHAGRPLGEVRPDLRAQRPDGR